MLKYREIVYLQGTDAEEPFHILDQSIRLALNHLLQWDYGEGDILTNNDICDSDEIEYIDNYIIGRNWHLDYIYLLEIIN
jgi:hypothetical protein